MIQPVTRRLLAAMLPLLLFASGCATAPNASAPEITLQLEQLPDAGFAVEDKGAVSIAYQLSVHNGRTDALTLRKIEMHTLGESPYTLRDVPAEMTEAIAPGADTQVTFTMWGYPREQRSSAKKTVWVSGAAWFDGPGGSVRKEFALSFREP